MRKYIRLILILIVPIFACENNTLKPGEMLEVGDCLVSNNRKFKLILQKDGNLILFKGQNEIEWSSNTLTDSASSLKMGEDGNLMLNKKNLTSYWSTNNSPARGAELILNDEGIIAITVKDSIFWSSESKNSLLPGQMLKCSEYLESKNKFFKLILHKDGNLVLYKKGHKVIWSTNTWNKPVKKCVMQKDGNLVLYDDQFKVCWSSNTVNKGGSKLFLQNDGNLVILHGSRVIWASGSVNVL